MQLGECERHCINYIKVFIIDCPRCCKTALTRKMKL